MKEECPVLSHRHQSTFPAVSEMFVFFYPTSPFSFLPRELSFDKWSTELLFDKWFNSPKHPNIWNEDDLHNGDQADSFWMSLESA